MAIHAVRRAQMKSSLQQSVLIFGAGAIGLLCAAVCRASGAVRVQIVDIQADRVNFATAHGYATDGMVIATKMPTNTDEGLRAARTTAFQACQVQSKTFEGFDVVLECTGVEGCTQAAIYVRHLLQCIWMSNILTDLGHSRWWKTGACRNGQSQPDSAHLCSCSP